MLSVSARLHVLSLSPAISVCACVQADRFHRACDAIVNTVVLIRVKENNFIFGGFTGDAAWSSDRHLVHTHARNKSSKPKIKDRHDKVKLVRAELVKEAGYSGSG